MKKLTLEQKIDKLIELMESQNNKVSLPYIPYVPVQMPPHLGQPLHYHGQIPCWNNPCVWA